MVSEEVAATSAPGPDDAHRRMGRTSSQTRALEERNDNHARLSVESLEDNAIFQFDRSTHIMAAYLAHAPDD